jgi:DNA-binding NarL/FixJ family response regulator
VDAVQRLPSRSSVDRKERVMATESSVLVVSDMPLLTDGILDAISPLPHIEVTAVVSDEENALVVVRNQAVDAVIAPVSLRPLGGYHLASELARRRPAPGVVLVDTAGTAGDAPPMPRVAILPRTADRLELASAIATARLPEAKGGSGHEARKGAAECTNRELEVLELVALGSTNKEIAQRLSIATQTVKSHVSALLAKFSASSRTQLALAALHPERD